MPGWCCCSAPGWINRTLINLGIISELLALTNNLVGVTIGMTYIMLPFMILPLHAAIRTIDPAIFQAASSEAAPAAASRWGGCSCRWWRPRLAAGALMVFVMSLGYFVTPSWRWAAPRNMMLAELIAQLVQSLLNWGLAGAAALVLLVVTLPLCRADPLVRLRPTAG